MNESVRLLAELLEMEPEFLEDCLRCGALGAEDLPRPDAPLPVGRAARLRRLRRLCLSLEVEVYAGAIIVDLLERLEAMERRR